MIGLMSRMARKQHKVLYAIVAGIFVNMMDNLCWQKIATYMFLHNEAVFKDISAGRSVWMRVVKYLDILSERACFSSTIIIFLSTSLSNAFFSFFAMPILPMSYAKAFARTIFGYFMPVLELFSTSAAYYNHISSKVKRLRSACLKITVKLSTHTKSRVLNIENLLSLSNISVAQCV